MRAAHALGKTLDHDATVFALKRRQVRHGQHLRCFVDAARVTFDLLANTVKITVTSQLHMDVAAHAARGIRHLAAQCTLHTGHTLGHRRVVQAGGEMTQLARLPVWDQQPEQLRYSGSTPGFQPAPTKAPTRCRVARWAPHESGVNSIQIAQVRHHGGSNRAPDRHRRTQGIGPTHHTGPHPGPASRAAPLHRPVRAGPSR